MPFTDIGCNDPDVAEGLGEFRFLNNINLEKSAHFQRIPHAAAAAQHAPPTRERALVLVGGGKDSAVAREVLRHAGVECDALSMGTEHWIATSAAAAG